MTAWFVLVVPGLLAGGYLYGITVGYRQGKRDGYEFVIRRLL
jgi:hypothetical protein